METETADPQAAEAVEAAAAAADASRALAQVEDEAALASPVAAMTDRDIASAWRTARALAASQLFKDARQAEQAFAKILIGRDLGLSPTEAMTNIHIVEGKPEMSANFHALRVKQKPGYDYRIVKLDDEAATIRFFGPVPDDETGEYRMGMLGESTFDMEDAARAKLLNKGKDGGPGTYEKYPRNMLFSRAMSNGVAWFCPEVLGSIRVYAPGEVESDVATVEQELRAPGEAPAVADAYDWMQVPEGVRDELRQTIGWANELMPGSWPPVKCEMTFTGRSETQLRRIAEGVRREIDRIEQARAEVAADMPDGQAPPADAEVVPDADGGEKMAEQMHGATPNADELRARESDLMERLPTAASDVEHAEMLAELEAVRAELAKLGGEAPGQSSLDA